MGKEVLAANKGPGGRPWGPEEVPRRLHEPWIESDHGPEVPSVIVDKLGEPRVERSSGAPCAGAPAASNADEAWPAQGALESENCYRAVGKKASSRPAVDQSLDTVKAVAVFDQDSDAGAVLVMVSDFVPLPTHCEVTPGSLENEDAKHEAESEGEEGDHEEEDPPLAPVAFESRGEDAHFEFFLELLGQLACPN